MPKKKPSLDATIRVPKPFDREIEAEAYRLDIFKYEVVELAWEAYVSRRGPQKLSGSTPYDAAVLEAIHALHKAKRTPEIEAILALLRAMAAKR